MLHRALHELQRLQARRAGIAIPPPLVLDVDVHEPEPTPARSLREEICASPPCCGPSAPRSAGENSGRPLCRTRWSPRYTRQGSGPATNPNIAILLMTVLADLGTSAA